MAVGGQSLFADDRPVAIASTGRFCPRHSWPSSTWGRQQFGARPNVALLLTSGLSGCGGSLMPFLKGDAKESPRKAFIYWSDDGDLMAIRYEQWKASFLEQNGEMSPKTPVGVWQDQFTRLRVPNLYNLRSDPFERGPSSLLYGDWTAHRMFVQVPMQVFAAQWLESFKQFPPRQKPASFNLDEVMRKMSASQESK